MAPQHARQVMLVIMKHSLIVLMTLSLGACAALPHHAPTSAPNGSSAARWQQLPGTYDNHEQVWQATQAKSALSPQHLEHRITSVADHAGQWDWTVSMPRAKGKPLQATWRYQLRVLATGQRMLTPQRPLPVAKDAAPQWASLAPCAMTGSVQDGVLQMHADIAACSAILPGLGAEGALLPTRFSFDGNMLRVATFADQPRGNTAVEDARRVRWFDGWVAINGGGPKAKADNQDWHVHRDLHLHDEGGRVAIRWRDGKPSGYSLLLERLTYAKRGTSVLKLSLVRDSDGDTVAYAWANPLATQIGLNLGWVQTGLTLESTPPTQ